MAPVGKAKLRFGDSSVSVKALLSAYLGFLLGRRPWACQSGLPRYLDAAHMWAGTSFSALIQGQGPILYFLLCVASSIGGNRCFPEV